MCANVWSDARERRAKWPNQQGVLFAKIFNSCREPALVFNPWWCRTLGKKDKLGKRPGSFNSDHSVSIIPCFYNSSMFFNSNLSLQMLTCFRLWKLKYSIKFNYPLVFWILELDNFKLWTSSLNFKMWEITDWERL